MTQVSGQVARLYVDVDTDEQAVVGELATMRRAVRQFQRDVDFAGEAMEQQTTRGRRGVRSLRGAIGGASLQLQDVAVQAQAGTDALIILGQQGSQAASAFGGVGLAVGAALAIGAAAIPPLVRELTDAEESLEELEEGAEATRAALDRINTEASDLADTLRELKAEDPLLFRVRLEGELLDNADQLRINAQRLVENLASDLDPQGFRFGLSRELTDTLEDLRNVDHGGTLQGLVSASFPGRQGFTDARQAIRDLRVIGEQLGLTREEAFGLLDAFNQLRDGETAAARGVLDRLTGRGHEELSRTLVELAAAVAEADRIQQESEQAGAVRQPLDRGRAADVAALDLGEDPFRVVDGPDGPRLVPSDETPGDVIERQLADQARARELSNEAIQEGLWLLQEEEDLRLDLRNQGLRDSAERQRAATEYLQDLEAQLRALQGLGDARRESLALTAEEAIQAGELQAQIEQLRAGQQLAADLDRAFGAFFLNFERGLDGMVASFLRAIAQMTAARAAEQLSGFFSDVLRGSNQAPPSAGAGGGPSVDPFAVALQLGGQALAAQATGAAAAPPPPSARPVAIAPPAAAVPATPAPAARPVAVAPGPTLVVNQEITLGEGTTELDMQALDERLQASERRILQRLGAGSGAS